MTEAATGRLATKATREPLEGQALLDFVARRVVKGDDAGTLGRKLGLPYAQAARLHAEVWSQVYRATEDAYGRDFLLAQKFAITQTLLEEIDRCKRAVALSFQRGEPNTRPYGHMNTAIKRLNEMGGHNAPTTSVTVDLKPHAEFQLPDQRELIDAHPDVQDIILAYKAKRRSLAAFGPDGGPGGLRVHDQRREVEALPAPGGDQPPPDEGGLGPVPPADDLRPAQARQE